MKRSKRVTAVSVTLVIGLLVLSTVQRVTAFEMQQNMVPAYTSGPNVVSIRTGILGAEIEKSQPAITFFYQPNGGNIGRFRIVYNSIIAFNDTGNGIFDEAEALYRCLLTSSSWNASQVTTFEDPTHGSYIVFSINCSLAMAPVNLGQGNHSQGGQPAEPISNWATLTFTYMIADKTYTRSISDEFSYNVTGNTELKIDINLVLHRGLPVKNITMEQFLYENEDLQRDHLFRLHESTGITVRSSSSGQVGPQGLVMNRYNQLSQLQQRIAFSTVEGIEEAYYSWLTPFNITSPGGIDSIGNLSVSYGTSGTELALYYSLPYSADYMSILMDPVIGIIEEGFLEAIEAFIVEHSDSLIVGGIVGIITSAGILYFASRKESGKEDEAVDLEHNPYYSGHIGYRLKRE